MQQKIKKPFLIIILLILSISLFSGCEQTNASFNVVQDKEEIKFPLINKNVVLTYWTAMSPKVATTLKDYSQIEAYKELEKRTGVKIKFIHPPIGQENEAFNIMIASNDIPDIILNKWSLLQGGASQYIDDSIIIPLNNYTEKYAPNYMKILKEDLNAKKQCTTDEGNIYMFSMLKMDSGLKVYRGLMLREDWMKKLNLNMPDNLDDWYNVLKAFKEKDPNGNGKADEIPFIAQKGMSGDLGEGLTNIINAFGVSDGFYQENGTVLYGPIQPQYKGALLYLKKLYNEKLLDQDYALTDGKQFDAKVTNNQAGAFSGALTGNMEKYFSIMKDRNKDFSLIGVPNSKGIDGKRTVINQNYVLDSNGIGAAITTKNKHIPESIMWLDYQYSSEGHTLMNYGIEGLTYTRNSSGNPIYTDVILKNPNGLSISDAMGKYVTAATDSPIVQDPAYLSQILIYPQQKASVEAWKKDAYLDKVLPMLSPSKDESSRYNTIMNDVKTYCNEMTNKFIMGIEPIENYDKFVKQIKQLGIDEAVKMNQSALERYKNK